MCGNEDEAFANAVTMKFEQYSNRTDGIPEGLQQGYKATLGHLSTLLNVYKSSKNPMQKDLIKKRLISHIQCFKAWKPGNPNSQTALQMLPGQSISNTPVPWRELKNDNGVYKIGPTGKGLTAQQGLDWKDADDGFCFVILVSKPTRILVGTRQGGGHTAISYGADVFYAGEIFFKSGQLLKWSNSSGHYKPSKELAEQVAHLLPIDKFDPHAETL